TSWWSRGRRPAPGPARTGAQPPRRRDAPPREEDGTRMGGTPRADAPRLDSKTYDMVIVGAGINGAAIARDAALRGLDVALVERVDYGGETSSWNSRLIHGGLRYLEHGELRLVHESLHDREHLWHVAPHLVTPLPFVVPLYRHNHVPGWMLRVGMVLY